MRSTMGFASLALVCLAACSAEGPLQREAPLGVQIRDSAGIRVLEDPVSPVGLPVEATIADAPLFTAGADEAEREGLFTTVGPMTFAAGDALVVADAGTSEVRFYDRNGALIAEVGGTGRGPGEFGRLTHLAYSERLRAFDSGLDRVTEFEMYGVVLSTYPVSVSSGGWPPEVAFLESGSLVIGQHILDGAPTVEGVELRQDSVLLLALHESATRTDTIGRFRGGESMNELRAFGEIRIVDMPPVPFGASFFVRALGSRVMVARSDQLKLHLYSDTGRLDEIWSFPGFEFEVADEDLAQLRATPGINGVVPSEDQVDSWLEAFPPSRLPAFSDLLVAEGQQVWIKAPRAEDAGLWWVMDGTGRLLGRVDVPIGLELRAVASDRIAGVRISELGVEHVEVYELVR